MTFMPTVSEGGPCADPSVGGPCDAIPPDVTECCGVNGTVSDCLSKSCCPARETEAGASQDNSADEPARPPFAECRVSDGQDCNLGYLRSELKEGQEGWVIYPEDAPACSSGSEYSFQVFPGPEANGRLMFWMQGGGGCNSYETCLSPDIMTAVPMVVYNTKGLFNMSMGDANPLVAGKWTVVVANYCSGDLFVGDTEEEMMSMDGTESGMMKYHGAKHVDTVLSWIGQQDFGTDSEGGSKRLAAGCSAGSLGAQLWAPAFFGDKGLFSAMLLDSFTAILAPYTANFFQETGSCQVGRNRIGWPQPTVDSCELGDGVDIASLTIDALKESPEMPALYVGSSNDIVQRGYYSASSEPLTADKSLFVESQTYINNEFTSIQEEIVAEFAAASNNFQSAIIPGMQHCFLPYQILYDPSVIVATDSGNKTLLEVVTEFLESVPNMETTTGPQAPSDDKEDDSSSPGSSLRMAYALMAASASAFCLAMLMAV